MLGLQIDGSRAAMSVFRSRRKKIVEKNAAAHNKSPKLRQAPLARGSHNNFRQDFNLFPGELHCDVDVPSS